jgi:RNA polymerase sigma-70 factor (ECF subfamily)
MTAKEYNECVDLFGDGLYRFMYKNLRNEDRSKDLVQDAFEKLWLQVDQVPMEKAKSYLFTVAYHKMIDSIRKESRIEALEEHHDQQFSNTKHYSDLKEILNKALSKLNEVQRSVIMLRDYEGYSYDEIGEIMNLSESQVKVYIFRGRQTLKNFLVKMDVVI